MLFHGFKAKMSFETKFVMSVEELSWTPNGHHIRKCEAINLHSCFSQGTYISNRHIFFSRKLETE